MNLIFGSMNFGPQIDVVVGGDMISTFIKKGFCEIDTAFVYNNGDTERMLGEILANKVFKNMSIATKVNPRVSGNLRRESVFSQLNESLSRMSVKSVDILYLHMPDPRTPIEETLLACADLFNEGKFKELGLSNFPAWMVSDIWHICKSKGLPAPSVYQGLYNAVSRKAEHELFDCLRRLNIRFYAFNPLAGGLLAGKHLSYEAPPAPGRFARLASYRKRYWKESYFEAINLIKEKCDSLGIKTAHAAYRWLAYHSRLDKLRRDGIIIGASNIDQLNENINAIEQGELPHDLLSVIDDAWGSAMLESPNYFYFYEQDQ